MNRLGFHHLAMIQALAATQSVSAAAKALGLTQSAVSHRMREAERRVDAALFYRDGRRVALTRAGRRLALAARTILNEAERAEFDLEQLARGVDYVIRLCGACYTPFHWFPPFYRRLRQDHPTYAAEVIVDVAEDPLTLLLANVADIVLMIGEPVHATVRGIPLLEDQLVAVMAAKHPLAQCPEISADDLARYPYATYHTTPERELEYERVFATTRKLPPEVISGGRTSVVLDLVAGGEILSIQPLLTVSRACAARGLITRPVKGGLPVTWYAALRASDDAASPPAVAVRLLREALGAGDMDGP